MQLIQVIVCADKDREAGSTSFILCALILALDSLCRDKPAGSLTGALMTCTCLSPQLLIPAELSHDAIDTVGELGQLQFKDLNADKSVFQRTYANQVGGFGHVSRKMLPCDLAASAEAYHRSAAQVKRTDEMARKLRFFHEQVFSRNRHSRTCCVYYLSVAHDDLLCRWHPSSALFSHSFFIFCVPQVKKEGLLTGSRLSADQDLSFDELEVKLDELESELLQLNANAEVCVNSVDASIKVSGLKTHCQSLRVSWFPDEQLMQWLGTDMLTALPVTQRLGRSHAELLELQLVLEVASQFFEDAQHSASSAQHERQDAFGGENGAESWLCCTAHTGHASLCQAHPVWSLQASTYFGQSLHLLPAGHAEHRKAVRKLSVHHMSAVTGDDSIGTPLLPEPMTEPKSVRLGFVSGLIAVDKVLAFERLLFRATRGNMYLKYASVGAVSNFTLLLAIVPSAKAYLSADICGCPFSKTMLDALPAQECEVCCAIGQRGVVSILTQGVGGAPWNHLTIIMRVHTQVVDPVTGEKQEKAVFVVFFAGDRARTKILKVRSDLLLLKQHAAAIAVCPLRLQGPHHQTQHLQC